MHEKYFRELQERLAPVREQLIHHSLYAAINSLEKLQVFMQHHIFAVWDFMSLLKTLQRGLTCVAVPWVPVGNAATRYLINEIVTGEESDVDAEGFRMSHFELYQKAMKEAGADTGPVDTLLRALQSGSTVQEALADCGAPASAIDFVRNTFSVVDSGKLHVQAAVFTFGREDLIPGMFISFVTELNKRTNNKVATFQYYLERHIEVDGGHHAHLAHEMTALLCGDDQHKWEEASRAAEYSLLARLDLWNSIAEKLHYLP